MNKLPMAEMAKTRESWLEAIDWAKEGNVPANILMTNTKTGHSVLDNVPQITCFTQCPVSAKCYDVKLIKLRPSVRKARSRRHAFMIADPDMYTAHAIAEIEMLRLKKGLTQVRIYTGGDFNPRQMPILRAMLKALPGVKFYMISKMIRNFPKLAAELLTFDNFFLNLSEMAEFRFGSDWDTIRKHERVNSVYTLMPDETDFSFALESDIVFNVSKAKGKISLYKENGLPLCPCDAKDIPAKGACDDCQLCATKGGVKGV
jgi:hypothetical protein